LNLGAGIINSAVERLENLDRFHPRVGAPERSFGRSVHGILVSEIFNRVAQDLQCTAFDRGERAANERLWFRHRTHLVQQA
jgi:hypothetical protein